MTWKFFYFPYFSINLHTKYWFVRLSFHSCVIFFSNRFPNTQDTCDFATEASESLLGDEWARSCVSMYLTKSSSCVCFSALVCAFVWALVCVTKKCFSVCIYLHMCVRACVLFVSLVFFFCFFFSFFFSRVLRDSIPRFVRRSVGRLVGWSVGHTLLFYSFYSYLLILIQLGHLKSN